MNRLCWVRWLWLCAAGATGAVLALGSGCSSLLPKPPPQPAFYSLGGARAGPLAARPTAPAMSTVSPQAPTLIVNPPRAASGFDSQRMIYQRQAYQVEYFAHSEWVDTPARMLAPLLVAAVEGAGAFRAVVPTPSAAAGDMRLETEIVRLQQMFDGPPSRVRFTLRAYLVDNATRQVMARREFDETVAAASDDPAGGVDAANRAVQVVLDRLAIFCTDAAATWQRPATDTRQRGNTGRF